MASILSNLQENDILFVDEIHRLNRQVEEVLYPAMEDYAIDIMIGKGASARFHPVGSSKIHAGGSNYQGRTFICTAAGSLWSDPTSGILYSGGIADHYCTVCKKLEVEIEPEGAAELAKRSRGTPRLANRLLKRVRDFAQVKYDGVITKEVASFALDLLEVDRCGLDKNDRLILMTIIQKFGGGPVGLETLAAAVGEDSGTIEDVYEPYLVKNGFLNRTPKGRVATALAIEHFKQ